MEGHRGECSERELTIALTYYDQPKMLTKQLDTLVNYPPELADRLRVVIVDDCSQRFPIIGLVEHGPVSCFEVYRVLDDIPWNQMGARNLAMRHTGWTLLLDLDHTAPEELIAYLLDELIPKARKDRYYLIPRVYARACEKMGLGPNLYMIHSEAYWKAGGMDESFRGHKGWSDITFRDALESQGVTPVVVRDAPKLLAWSWRDWKEHEPVLIPDAAVTTLDRDIRYNEGKRNRLREKIRRQGKGGWKGYIEGLRPLRFSWTRVHPPPCP